MDIPYLSQGLASDEEGNLYWLMNIPPGTYANGAFTNTMDGEHLFIFKYNPQGEFVEAIFLNMDLNFSAGRNLKFYWNLHNGHFYFTTNKDEGDSAIINGEALAVDAAGD